MGGRSCSVKKPSRTCRWRTAAEVPPELPNRGFEQPSSPLSVSEAEKREGSEAMPIAGAIARNLYQAYTVDPKSSNSVQQQQLPMCSKDLAVQGVWLPAHPTDKQSWRKANYTWTLLGCTFGKPLNLACLESKKDATTKKILFQGDESLSSTSWSGCEDRLLFRTLVSYNPFEYLLQILNLIRGCRFFFNLLFTHLISFHSLDVCRENGGDLWIDDSDVRA